MQLKKKVTLLIYLLPYFFFAEISNEEAVRKLREEKISRDATQAERIKWEAELSKQLELLRKDLSSRLQKVAF